MTTKVTGALQEDGTKGADIASAGTLVVGTDGSYFDITGTTGITGFTVDAGRTFTLQFDGIVTLTNGASLVLSGAANFTTAAGDRLTFTAVAADTVVQVGHSLVSGGSPVASAGPSYYLGSLSVNTANASATVAYTGVGFQPTHVIFLAGFGNNAQSGIGFDDGTSPTCNYGAFSGLIWRNSGNRSIFQHMGSTSNTYEGDISTFSADGFSIAWVRTNTPTGTLDVEFLAFK